MAAKFGNLELKFNQFNAKTVILLDDELIDNATLLPKQDGLVTTRVTTGIIV